MLLVMLLLSTNLLKNTEQCYLCIKSLMYIYYVSVTLELYCCPKTKLKHISEPHWMTYSFNAKNMNTIYSIYIYIFLSQSHILALTLQILSKWKCALIRN